MSILDAATNSLSTPQVPRRHLLGPWQDTMLLGGASVLAFVLLQSLPLTESLIATLAVLMLALAHFVNHPHFAHSYQMFYGGWRSSTGVGRESDMRHRWRVVGIVIPALLASGLWVAYWAAVNGNGAWLSAYLSLMGLLVGWHYVKQGFGMAMLDAVLRRRFFSPAERKSLLVNAYTCWACAWALISDLHSRTALFGYPHLTVDIPDFAIVAVCAAACTTTAHAGLSSFRAMRRWRGLGAKWSEVPTAGVLAYVVTLYLWTVFSWVNPAYALMIPFFHSLQYLTVVWHYKRNELSVRGSLWKSWSCVRFFLIGIALGALGFWLLPGTVEFLRTGHVPAATPYAAAPAIVCAWVFINIHHYFIDSVLWRHGNPAVSKHLFGRESKPIC